MNLSIDTLILNENTCIQDLLNMVDFLIKNHVGTDIPLAPDIAVILLSEINGIDDFIRNVNIYNDTKQSKIEILSHLIEIRFNYLHLNVDEFQDLITPRNKLNTAIKHQLLGSKAEHLKFEWDAQKILLQSSLDDFPKPVKTWGFYGVALVGLLAIASKLIQKS